MWKDCGRQPTRMHPAMCEWSPTVVCIKVSTNPVFSSKTGGIHTVETGGGRTVWNQHFSYYKYHFVQQQFISTTRVHLLHEAPITKILFHLGRILPIDLCLNFEIPSLKNQVNRTWFQIGLLQATQAVKIKFEIGNKLFIKLDFLN